MDNELTLDEKRRFIKELTHSKTERIDRQCFLFKMSELIFVTLKFADKKVPENIPIETLECYVEFLQSIQVDLADKEWAFQKIFNEKRSLLKRYGDLYEGNIFKNIDTETLVNKLEQEAIKTSWGEDANGIYLSFIYPMANVTFYSKTKNRDAFYRNVDVAQFDFLPL